MCFPRYFYSSFSGNALFSCEFPRTLISFSGILLFYMCFPRYFYSSFSGNALLSYEFPRALNFFSGFLPFTCVSRAFSCITLLYQNIRSFTRSALFPKFT
jgi:hypothetical protein